LNNSYFSLLSPTDVDDSGTISVAPSGAIIFSPSTEVDGSVANIFIVEVSRRVSIPTTSTEGALYGGGITDPMPPHTRVQDFTRRQLGVEMTVSDIDTKQCRVIGPMGLVF